MRRIGNTLETALLAVIGPYVVFQHPVVAALQRLRLEILIVTRI